MRAKRCVKFKRQHCTLFQFNNFEKVNERDSQYTVVNLTSGKPARQRSSDGIGEFGVGVGVKTPAMALLVSDPTPKTSQGSFDGTSECETSV